MAGLYWGNGIAGGIQHRKFPGVTYAVYTAYESDEHGDYTYFIGEAVESFEGQNVNQFEMLTLPASDYQKFTTNEGSMPEVVIAAWQEIWAMDAASLGGKRKYCADFEVYDERALNPRAAVLDIYIGIE